MSLSDKRSYFLEHTVVQLAIHINVVECISHGFGGFGKGGIGPITVSSSMFRLVGKVHHLFALQRAFSKCRPEMVHMVNSEHIRTRARYVLNT